MKRYTQIASWILIAPLLGAIQAVASLFVPMIQHSNLGNHDPRLTLLGLALVYGGGWFLAALLLSDVLLLSRPLARHEFVRYLSVMAVTAAGIGLLLPGMMARWDIPRPRASFSDVGFGSEHPDWLVRNDAFAG